MHVVNSYRIPLLLFHIEIRVVKYGRRACDYSLTTLIEVGPSHHSFDLEENIHDNLLYNF